MAVLEAPLAQALPGHGRMQPWTQALLGSEGCI